MRPERYLEVKRILKKYGMVYIGTTNNLVQFNDPLNNHATYAMLEENVCELSVRDKISDKREEFKREQDKKEV